MKLLADYCRAKAQLCRELADTLVEQRSLVVSRLCGMADEFDRNAGVLGDRLAKEGLGEALQADTPDQH